jgi:DNA-binding response OmpR family regulator
MKSTSNEGALYLNQLGYYVDLSDESATAIQAIQGNIYDLIMVDINLQGIRLGKKIIRKTRENQLNLGTPIIAWSAYFNKNDEEEYLAWGADTALIKNCGLKGLKKAIYQCLLAPRYEREFYYKLKRLQKKWKKNGSIEWVKQIKDSHRPYIVLDETLRLINEYQQGSNFHAEGKKSPS